MDHRDAVESESIHAARRTDRHQPDERDADISSISSKRNKSERPSSSMRLKFCHIGSC